MYKFKPYVMNTKNPEDIPIMEFDNIENLAKQLDIDINQDRFCGFAQKSKHIMMIYDHGFAWSVIGFVQEHIEGIPDWDYGKYVINVEGVDVAISGKNVKWTSGDDVCGVSGNIYKRGNTEEYIKKLNNGVSNG